MRTRALVAYNGADSGLGNRVRVVLGAKVLAEHEDRLLLYVWPTGPLFGPAFTDLWDFRGGMRISRSLSRAMAPIWPYENEDLTKPSRVRVRQIRTGSELRLPPGLRSWREEFRDMTPSPEISDRVRRFSEAHLKGHPYVGVQIRSHQVSHQKTKEASPVSWFERRMTEIASRQPGTVFFVSSDVPEVLSRLQGEVPNVYGLTDKGGYNTTEGVKSAVVDLYLLAGSGYLLGSHFSSFLHLAEYLSGERVPVETSQSAAPEMVDLSSSGSVLDATRPALRAATGASASGPL